MCVWQSKFIVMFCKKRAGAKYTNKKKGIGGTGSMGKGIFQIILCHCNQYLLLLSFGLPNLC